MKKSMVSVLLLLLPVLIVGCLDYKAYEIPQDENTDLIDEIAAIEEEVLGEEGIDRVDDLDEELDEDVVLPEFDEEPADVVEEDDLDTLQVKENELVRLNVKVSDPDQDNVTYSFSKPLNKKGEWQTNYGDAGEYIITITATDGILVTEQRVKIAVQRVNVAPVIASLRDLEVEEGEVVTLEPEVNDPNGDAVSVTVSGPLKTGTFVTDHTSAGEYDIIITASDGELESEASFTLTILDVNVLPEISGLDDLTVDEGETVRIAPAITDLDQDDLTVTISDPVGNDGVWETGYTDNGVYVVTVTVHDGKDTVMEKVTVTVNDINMPPVINDVYLDVN